jgi:D-inositol-3-phosphate glycosyltransferase
MPLRGSVDQPASGDRLWRATPVRLRGWALEGLEPVVSVDVLINGSPSATATLGHQRPDVPFGLQEPAASPGSGWLASVDLSTYAEPQVQVQVVAVGRSGNRKVLLDDVFTVREEPFAGSLDMPVLATGNVITVRGWAFAGGRGPAAVEVELDGVPVGRARLRVPLPHTEMRPEGTEAAGFEHVVVLDPAAEPRPHTVGAVVTGMDGSHFRLDECTTPVVGARSSALDEPQAALLRASTQDAVRTAPRATNPPAQPGAARLLVFTPQLDLSGAQLYLHELLRQLVPGLRSCTVVSPVDGDLRPELQQLGLDVVVTGTTPPTDLVAYEGRVRDLAMLILGSGCDVVLVNTLGEVEAVDAATRLGIPTVWAIHESFQVDHWLAIRFEGREHPYIGERLKASLGAATRLVFVSETTGAIFSPYAPPQHRVVMPYGVEVDDIAEYTKSFDCAAWRERHGIAPDATVLLCAGTVEERKSQTCLVEAFAEVATAYPEAVLVIVGDRGGAYSEALRRQVEALRLGDRLRVLPVTMEIWEWYAMADVLVSASDVESLPRTMLEAMAFGVPVLAADVFGVPELVSDGDNGWLFAPRDMRALVAALRRMLGLSAEERRRAGEAGLALARQRYSSTIYADGYRALFSELASPPALAALAPASASEAANVADHLHATVRDVDDAIARTCAVVRPYTMTSPQRVVALCEAIRYVSANRIGGDVVECGVWRGGSMLAAARSLLERGDTQRTLWLYDTFSGMTPPTAEDRRLIDRTDAAALLATQPRSADVWAVADLDDVRRTMSLCDYPEERVRYVVGPVEETIPGAVPKQIAVLRLDTDWYASTLHELIHLFPRLSPGGVLIIDDYGDWEGARRAVDEYLASIQTPVLLTRIDHTGRMAVVPR